MARLGHRLRAPLQRAPRPGRPPVPEPVPLAPGQRRCGSGGAGALRDAKPARGRLVPNGGELERFDWCGLSALLGCRSPHPFEAVDETLALFDDDRRRAQQRLRELARHPHTGGPSPPERSPVGRTVVRARVQPRLRRPAATKCAPTSGLRWTRCGRAGASSMLAAARSALAVRAARELGLSGAEIGRRLGVTKAGRLPDARDGRADQTS